MAGIFSDVSTDIQKLRQLKAEIENVKKALKGIDVNVKIDIAKGMEAQLQSLMKKYDALVKKVSEAEGKIMSSTKRINDASEKIIKAQEQLSKAAGMNTKPDNGNADVSLNNVGTANVQAQAKAYDELAKEIDSVMGTRSQNIKRMIDEQNAIRLINEEIKKLTKFQTGNSTLTNTQQKRLEQLNNSLLTHKAALSDVRQTLMNNVKLDNSATTSMNGISQSLSRMRIAYRELTEEERNSPFGKELLASIQQADAKIKELDATIGNHQRNVGNYAKGYNGLNMSVQQIVRELPSATMGLNMFFLAISNNLPILTDEIKRAKAANEELKTSGQKGVPVWKQVASSLFSWQSALMVGITLLTVHGDKVWEWIKSIFKGKDVLDEVKESQEDINKRLEEENRVRKSAAQSVSSLLTEYKKLQVEYKSLNGSVQKQNKFIKDNQDEFRKLGVSVNDVTDAENLFIKNETAFITSLQHRAMAAAAMAQMETEYKKVIDRMVEMEDYIASGGNNESINMAQGITDNYIASLLKQKGVINSTQSAYPYIDLIKQGKWQSNKDLQGTGIDWSKEYNAYYQNQLSMLVGAEAADRFNRQTEESQKKIETLAKVVRKESEAAKESLDEAGLDEYVTTNDNDKQKQEQEKLYDQLLQLRFKNQQDEINLMKEGADKKRKQIELDYQKEYAEIQKLEKEWSAKNGGQLTQEQSIEISRRYTNAEEKKNKSLYDIDIDSLKAEKDALNTYLQEYGTFQQRKYAIAQEYADKIAKAQTEAEKLKLSKDRDSKITAIDTEVLKSEIDWGTVFGEFGGMFSDMIKPALDDAKKYMQTDEFKNSDASSQQALVEAVNQMEKSLGGAGTLNFKKLGEDVKAYQDALLSLNDAKAHEIEAIEKLKKAQEEYENALKNGTESEKQSAKDALDTAQINANAASENVQAQTSIVSESQRQVSDTSRKLKASMDNVIEGLQKISSGSLTSIYSGLIQAGKGIGGAISKVSESLESVPIIGWIVSIIDVFKDGLSVVVEGILDAVLNAVSGIIGDVLSGDLLVTIGESLVKGISNIFDALTWGGFSKWVKNGDSDKTLESDTERLVASNEDLKNSIDKLSEKMEDSSIAEANDIYDKQVANLKQSIANTQELMIRNLKAYSNGFLGIGGDKSSSHEVNEGTTANDWSRISSVVGRTIGSASDFFSMSPEEMLKVFEQAPDLYSKIKALADDGYKNAAQYMDEYIAYASEMEELSVALGEKLTSTTFDSVRDDFKSTLLDMESDAEDFTDNFEKMMQNAAIEALMGNFDSQLKSWYDDFAKAMGDDGQLSKSEQENLRRKYDNLVNRGLAERDALMEAMGWDNEESIKEQQSASSRGFGSEMTHEDAGELSGRFTAVYESNLRIETATQQQTVAITELRGSISVLTGQVSGMYNIADETRTILANSYLELQQIRENTGEIIKPIKQIQLDMAEVKQNTSRL